MQKIIKLSDNHYIGVDDSEMKVGDLNIPSDCSKIADISTIAEEDLEIVNRRGNGYLKITHSTQPLEELCCTPQGQIKRYVDCKGCDRKQLGFVNIKPLSLQQVEEAIYRFNLEKDAYDLYPEVLDNDDGRVELYDLNKNVRDAYIRGFNTHKEIVKDKLFTVEDMMEAFTRGYIDGTERTEDITYYADKFHKSLILKRIKELEDIRRNGSSDNEDDAICPYPESKQNAVDWHNGYNKAKEKYKWTNEDVIRIVEKSRETGLTAEYLLLSLMQVVMWLYEKHGIWIYPFRHDFNNQFYWHIDTAHEDEFTSDNVFNSPTEAYEAAIDYVLKNLI